MLSVVCMSCPYFSLGVVRKLRHALTSEREFLRKLLRSEDEKIVFLYDVIYERLLKSIKCMQISIFNEIKSSAEFLKDGGHETYFLHANFD